MTHAWLWLLVAGLAGSPAMADTLDEQDRRVRFMADEINDALLGSGVIVDDPVLQAYFDETIRRLFPRRYHEITMRAYDSADANAFALPNGSIYVSTALLARIQNDAELALVAAHEGEHYVQRHGARATLTAKRMSAVGFVGDTAIGLPLFSGLVIHSSFAGYSRRLEAAADEGAFHRVVTAGFGTAGLDGLFARLAREARAVRRRDPSLFASHPKLARRAATIRRLVSRHVQPAPEQAAGEFLPAAGNARLRALDRQLEHGRVAETIYMLADEGLISTFPEVAHYHLGDALRRRGRDGDAERVVHHLERALRGEPQFGLAFRSLGLHHLAAGRAREGIDAFRRYTDLHPDAADRALIESYIARLEEHR